MVYVALLRGINVGGQSQVAMPKLKATFESLGCQQVSTYINSGNVIFSDARTAAQLVPLIEKGILKDFGLEIRVILRDLATIRELCQRIPADWTNDADQKTDVLFLWDEVDNPEVIHKVAINPELEHVLYIAGALVWNIGRQNVTKGNGVKLIKTDLYQHMTARNINTVRKLHELMSTPHLV